MVSFTLLKSASLLALVSTLASSVSAKDHHEDKCHDFRVTAPHSYFNTTAGQYYQVSYDFGGHKPAKPSWISVDLYERKTDKLVDRAVKKVRADGIATPWFNLDVKKTGDYYFLVKYGHKCKPIKTPYFHITYNKNSPPAICN